MSGFTALIAQWLGAADVAADSSSSSTSLQKQQRPFEPTRELCETDLVLVDMLNSAGHEDVCYCVCDPHDPDCPIIFASPGFCRFTGYSCAEIEGRNCRFLQGPETAAAHVQVIRTAIQGYMLEEQDELSSKSDGAVRRTEPVSVNLLNYRKDGSSFSNEFFLAPLRSSSSSKSTTNKVQYLIGVQCPVAALGRGQAPKNAGYVLGISLAL